MREKIEIVDEAHMDNKQEKIGEAFKIKIEGPGVSIDRSVSHEDVVDIVRIALGGASLPFKLLGNALAKKACMEI